MGPPLPWTARGSRCADGASRPRRTRCARLFPAVPPVVPRGREDLSGPLSPTPLARAPARTARPAAVRGASQSRSPSLRAATSAAP